MNPLALVIDAYSFLVLIAIILSWVPIGPGSPLVLMVHRLTEPALAPIRQALPPMGGLDLSPMVLLIGLRLLRGLIG